MGSDVAGWLWGKTKSETAPQPIQHCGRVYSIKYWGDNPYHLPSIGIHDEQGNGIVFLKEENFYQNLQKLSKNEIRFVYEKILEAVISYGHPDNVPIYFLNMINWFVNDSKRLGITLRES